ncbi:unnamed protein product [Pieris macdunnoughi]|uniref:Peptidase S1 domain-containing protein n=1 Tax=Pieris macdunnoughi TaxID=345717 RepID=A0A821VTI9_9NEOP|nr:unnamed protein product [Pieris macdunnoughi]
MKSFLGFVFLLSVKLGFSQNTSYLDTISHLSQTRRILRGSEVGDTRPYMVYLRPASTESKVDANWLCGGVIVDAQYIITSAACIEDVRHFYVVSGTHRWVPKNTDDECIRNGAKKAIWKCVPQNYVFDGNHFDNIRWMINDIAVVRVEDDFNFERRVRGWKTPEPFGYNHHMMHGDPWITLVMFTVECQITPQNCWKRTWSLSQRRAAKTDGRRDIIT